MTDEVLEALVAIRDAKVALQTAERALGDKIRRDQKTFHEIMNAVRESDEATTGTSMDVPPGHSPRFHEPNHNPVAIPCASSGEPPLAPHICYEAMDEL